MTRLLLAALLAVSAATVTAATVTATSASAAAPRTWHFTGKELLAALEGKMPTEFRDPAHSRLLSSARAQSYISGVADLTQNQLWCTVTGVLPHELAGRVHTALRELDPASLGGNAAPLVAEALRQAFPCPASTIGRNP
ncbi:Tiorf68 protein [plant metagenome]|uniref:Tiorf68 protein n=1 Tax=plant metagenome TaxID=1297885 RepID=A0A484TEU4_9ZZZZ